MKDKNPSLKNTKLTGKAFRTYQKSSKKKLSIVSLVILCVLLVILAVFLINAFLQAKILENLYEAAVLLFLIIFGFIVFKSYNQQEKLREEITGTLELLPSRIILNQKAIELNEIKHLSVQINDFEGKRPIHSSEPAISNGFDNELSIFLNSKEIIRTNFEQQYEGQFAKINRDNLIEYFKVGVLSIDNLLEVLKIEDADEIQKFKSEMI